VQLHVKVVSARQLPQVAREVIGSYVLVEVRGHDSNYQEQRTRGSAQTTGWDPPLE
jgi:hypothetical protein